MINSQEDDEIEVTLRGPRSRFEMGQLSGELVIDDQNYAFPIDYTVTLKNVKPGEITVKVVKSAKQKQIEALDKQIADLQARRTELLGVSYWCNVHLGRSVYYRNLVGKEKMQFFVSPSRVWEDGGIALEDVNGHERFMYCWKPVDFADLPEEIKLIEKDCE